MIQATLLPEAAFGKGVGGDDDTVSRHRPRVGIETPALAGPLGRTRGALRMNDCARGQSRARQPTCVGERLDGAGAHVEERARIKVAADPARRLLATEDLHRRSTRAPLRMALFDLGEARGPGRAMQSSVAHEFAVDAMFHDAR